MTTSEKIFQIGECVGPIRTWNPARDSEDETFRYIDISSVSQEEKRIIPNGEIPIADAPSRARQLVQSGDVLVSTVRPNLNAVAFVPEEMDGATASTGFCVLRPEPSRVHGRYLYHWVRSPRFVSDMTKQATGQSYPAVSDRIIKQSFLPLPSLRKQKSIAAILDQADEIRWLRQRATDQFNELEQAVFQEMFGAMISDTGRWPSMPFSELVASSKIGLVRSSAELDDSFDTPYLRMDAIQRNGTLDLQNIKRTRASHDEKTIFDLRPGDFLFNTRNSKELVGKTAVVETENDMIFNNNILRVRFVGSVSAQYMNLYFRQPFALRELELRKSGTTSVFAIYQKSLDTLPVAVPPPELQEKFAFRIKAEKTVKDSSKSQLAWLESLFSSLQNRAFSGEL